MGQKSTPSTQKAGEPKNFRRAASASSGTLTRRIAASSPSAFRADFRFSRPPCQEGQSSIYKRSIFIRIQYGNDLAEHVITHFAEIVHIVCFGRVRVIVMQALSFPQPDGAFLLG